MFGFRRVSVELWAFESAIPKTHKQSADAYFSQKAGPTLIDCRVSEQLWLKGSSVGVTSPRRIAYVLINSTEAIALKRAPQNERKQRT